MVQVIVSHGDGISVLCPSSPAAAVGFLTAVVFDCTLKSNFLFFPVLLHILKCNLLPFLSFIAQSFLKVPPQSCPIPKKKYPKKLSAICPSPDYLLQHCGNCFCTIPQNHFNLDQIFTTHLLVIINSFCRNEMKHRDHRTIFVVNNHHNQS